MQFHNTEAYWHGDITGYKFNTYKSLDLVDEDCEELDKELEKYVKKDIHESIDQRHLFVNDEVEKVFQVQKIFG